MLGSMAATKVNDLRQSDLNANSTRYDFMVAAPPQDTLVIMWSAWVVNQSLITVFCLVVFCGIILSRKIRQNVFNSYLIFLMIPDIFMAAGCLIVCAINAAKRHYRSLSLCKFQSFNHIFGMTANAWLNAIIARQMLLMLRASASTRRYHPPTRRSVAVQALAVYFWASFVASWGIVDIPWLPHGTSAANGMACIPVEESIAHTIFLWLVFMPAFLGCPSVYVLWVGFVVWRGRLLPPMGQHRMLSIYFFRIIAVFVVMWIPTLITLYGMSGTWGKHPWFFWIIGSWTHYQGLVSAVFSLMKPDIKEAVKNFICCGVCTHDISIESADLSRVNFSRRSIAMAVQKSFRQIFADNASREEHVGSDDIFDDVEVREFGRQTATSPTYNISDDTERRVQVASGMSTPEEENFNDEELGSNNLHLSSEQIRISGASPTTSICLRKFMVDIPEGDKELQIDRKNLFVGFGYESTLSETARVRYYNRRASDGTRGSPRGDGLGRRQSCHI